MTVQEAKYSVAMADLEKAQAQLNEKEAELQEVQSMYERAVKEKQVLVYIFFNSYSNITSE